MADRLAFAVPGDLEARTGGSVYDRRVMAALRLSGWEVGHLAWPAGFPFPAEAEREAAAASLAALPDGAVVVIDGLAYGALPDLAEREGGRLALVALVHHPLALETGLSGAQQALLAASERRALAAARAVIATSRTTAATLQADYGVASVAVAAPGVDVPGAWPAPRPERRPGPPRLFCLGSLTPRKAHAVLVEALAGMADLPWTCVIAGSPRRAPGVAEALARQIGLAGLGGRIRLAGEVSDGEAAGLYADADIFVLASLYEGYGMVFAEAMAHGLPVVATTGGAIPEVVGPEAGVLVPPGDAAALQAALCALVQDEAMRKRLGAGAVRAALEIGGWDRTAARIARVVGALR